LFFGVCGVFEVVLMIVEELVIELVLVEVFVLLFGEVVFLVCELVVEYDE